MNDITPLCGTFPFRHLILKVLYQIPTLLVGVPPSATDKGQPELINEGRMLADERENVRFIFADRENWQRKRERQCLCRTGKLCISSSFSSFNSM